jgi:putative ABC transport system substrate-binding protein
MNRRQLIAGLGGAALSLQAPGAMAQERRIARLGFIGGGLPSDSAAFLSNLRIGLERQGYSGANLRLAERYAERSPDRIQGLVDDLEQSGVDVILTHAAAVLLVVRARRATPVVYQLSADPVSVGLTAELAKPQNNATGVTLLAAELNSKRLELIREIIPASRRISVIYNPLHGGEHLERAWIEDRARALDFTVSYNPAKDRPTLDKVLAATADAPPDAVLLLSDGFLQAERAPVLALAARMRLPTIAGWTIFAESGALCSYGPRIPEMIQRTASYVDRLLYGARAADLPIERPNLFELAINLDTAAKLGLTLPATVIARADRVIE